MSVLSTLLKSSIPRILIVVTTTIGIVSLNTQFKQRSRASRILWLIKDSFPIILLIDCILTKTLLLRIFVDQQGYLTGSYNNDESNNANGKAAVAAAVAKDGAVSSAWTTSTTHDDKEERVVSSSFGSTFNERQSEVVEVDSYYFK